MARTCTYLNFTNKSEEAFLFYQSIFGGEFTGGGISRFKDIPASEGMPPMSDEVKNLVMHIELPILGGHILMATDAPEFMGFKLNIGDNVHLCLEPDTRKDTKSLFDALAEGGQVTMELQDTFWGAYCGKLTDQFGVQWMFNYVSKQ